MARLRPIEFFLIQFVLYFLLWLWDDYLALLLSLTFGIICFFILLIALISEKLEKSKVPRSYFVFMAISVITPFIVACIYLLLTNGELDWLK